MVLRCSNATLAVALFFVVQREIAILKNTQKPGGAVPRIIAVATQYLNAWRRWATAAAYVLIREKRGQSATLRLCGRLCTSDTLIFCTGFRLGKSR